jgi:MSHA biogenesis protein MshG
MIAAGEESAELPRMCDIVARHYHRDVGHMTKNIGTVIEPVLVAGMAALVLGVALAIFLPMWNMVSLLE